MTPAPPAADPRKSSGQPRADLRAGPSRGREPPPADPPPAPRPRGDRPPAAPPAAPSRRRAPPPAPLAHLAAEPKPEPRPPARAKTDRARSGPRDAFQRDRDRIIHSVPFRRLRHKTQVFVAPDGDHFRVRLTHSLEVAQIGRTSPARLGLNEDLTEALCLAHDIGHPPFGHAGEDALEAAMAGAGGFDHNAHTIRLLTRLESPYPRFDGLNLSWETLEGLAKHNGPVAAPLPWALAEADACFPLDLAGRPGLEAQVAAIADDIAYDNHDIDDGLRAGLFTLEELLDVPLVARGWAAVTARYPGVAEARLVPELVRDLIGAMVNDVLAETRARTAGMRHDRGGARRRPPARRLLGGDGGRGEGAQSLPPRPHVRGAAGACGARGGAGVLAALFAAYRDDPRLLPEEWRPASSGPTAVARARSATSSPA